MNHSDRAASPYALTIRPLTATDRGSLAELPDRVSPQSAISRWLVTGAASVLTDPQVAASGPLTPATAVAVLSTYAVVLLTVATGLVLRRDVAQPAHPLS